ncbi:hypothetical protein DSO57_1022133 [Entomophthora muscae]|uniref:Uncharacterized protein n=1 Tax=Entomophthora muscae TaxID=34485 RepID=A0ACC2UDC2_9FUNG|nr:hypothetical protein DSO57_1022133 [Entomophthora muscae]
MVFNSNIFNGASSQDSFNRGEVQGVEAPIYTQAFEAGNKEADLYLTTNPYGFDLFSGHIVSSSAPAPIPTPAQAACQPTNQDGNLDLEHLPTASQPAPHTANQALAPPAQHPKHRIITAQILQEIVALNLQGLSWNQIAAQLQFNRATIMWGFNNLMNKGNLIGTGKKPKKAPESQITKAYPIMLDLLQRDPKLSLTQVCKQLAHHNIWVSKRMMQLWMHGKVASIWVLKIFASNQWDGAEDSPYDIVIQSILVQCLTSLTDDICGETLHQSVAGILIVVESFLTEWDPDCLLNRAIILDVHSID